MLFLLLCILNEDISFYHVKFLLKIVNVTLFVFSLDLN